MTATTILQQMSKVFRKISGDFLGSQTSDVNGSNENIWDLPFNIGAIKLLF